MTIEVTHYRGVHQGGTKEYSLILFFSPKTKRALLVKRWGKVNADGQVKIETCTGTGDAELNKALSERSGKGYDMQLDKGLTGPHPTVDEAIEKSLARSHRSSFYKNQLALLDPKSFSTDDRKAYDPFEADRAAARESAEAKARAEQEAAAAAQRAADEAAMESNPIFGMF